MSDQVVLVRSEAEFQEAIKSGVVLADFYATWCGPCKMMHPILEQLAASISGKAKIIKIDTDMLPDLSQKFDISSIPTLILFQNGNVIDKMIGLQQAAKLQAAIEQIL
ncbi:MAG: thioredoxin [Thermoguttaceae bacterium]